MQRDFNAIIGNICLLEALLAAGAGFLSSLLNIRKTPPTSRAKIYFNLMFLGIVGSVFAILRALVSHDFKIFYVYQVNNIQTNFFYDITGMWSSLSGSLLLWAFLLALWMLALIYFFKDQKLLNAAMAILFCLNGFFLFLILFPANLFSRTPFATSNGLGANPLLQTNWLIGIHPIFLYLGLTGLFIPFAISLSFLILKAPFDLYIYKNFLILPTAFLSAGIILGQWWSYQVLGWGGFWSWDPVENASLIPWLFAIGAIHAAKAKQGNIRPYNLVILLGFAAFYASLFTTFITRSGIIQSVHAFSFSDLGPYLLGFMGACIFSSLFFLLRASYIVESPFIKFLTSPKNLLVISAASLFVAFAAIVFVGTAYPLLPIAASSSSIGAPFFNQFGLPIGIATLLLIGFAPFKSEKNLLKVFEASIFYLAFSAAIVFIGALLGLKGPITLLAYFLTIFAFATTLMGIAKKIRVAKSTASLTTGRLLKTTSFLISHFGIILFAFALITSISYEKTTSLNLQLNKPVRYQGHEFLFKGIKVRRATGNEKITGNIVVDRATYHPSIELFNNSQGIGLPSIDSTWLGDIYLTLQSIPNTKSSSITIGVIKQPLIDWMWFSNLIIFIGFISCVEFFYKFKSPSLIGKQSTADELREPVLT